MEDKIWTLLKEGKTKEDAKNEIIEKTKMRNTKKEGVEKEEKSEEFYMSADNATPVVKIQHLEPEDKREKKHRARNTGEKFKCEHCDSLATWDASLKKHSGEKYMCKKCGFMTTWNVSLRVHSRIHIGEKYKCKQCDFLTTWAASLRKHSLIHSESHQMEKSNMNQRGQRSV